MYRIGVIGAGFVGLATATVLAERGHEVICSDVQEKRVNQLNDGQLPIVEDELEEVMRKFLKIGTLRFTTSNLLAVSSADYVFLCLATPSQVDGTANVDVLYDVIKEIREQMKPGAVLVVKSTVPIGTTRKLRDVLSRFDCSVVSNPEFLREGRALFDSRSPDRIIIGADNLAIAREVGKLFTSNTELVQVSSYESAELIKYASNAFLAMKVSYINDIAALCEAFDTDIAAVVQGVGSDTRIGREFLNPGPGWGGSCFPKDTLALTVMAENVGVKLELVEATIRANERHRYSIVEKIKSRLTSTSSRVAVLGLTFKAGTSDVRESPSIEIVQELIRQGLEVVAFDPTVRTGSDLGMGKTFRIVDSPLEACISADVIAVLTEWDDFRLLDPNDVGHLVRHRAVIDARNHLDQDAWVGADFDYVGVGRI